MNVWCFDEDRADFRPALPGEIEADPDALYIIQRGDVLMVREDGGPCGLAALASTASTGA